MGTRERRRREVALREQHILDTAQKLIQREGLLNLQMSRLADACDYAVGTLYQHFARKEDLLVALNTRNSISRVELFERAGQWSGPTRERILAFALADMLMLEQSPEAFRLSQFVFTEVVWGAASPERRREALAAGDPIEKIVTDIVLEARHRRELSETLMLSPLEVTLGLWTQCIGMHNLVQIEGALDARETGRPYLLLFKHLNHLLNGYGWQPLMPVVDDETVSAQMQRLGRDVFGVSSVACAAAFAENTPNSIDQETLP